MSPGEARHAVKLIAHLSEKLDVQSFQNIASPAIQDDKSILNFMAVKKFSKIAVFGDQVSSRNV